MNDEELKINLEATMRESIDSKYELHKQDLTTKLDSILKTPL
ncbi:MAG: hypothetical protein ACK521_10895 [bacterium]